MVEERVTRIDTPGEGTQTHTTIVTDGPRRSGGGFVWIIVLMLVVVAVLAFVLLSPMSTSEVAKDNAVADAASSVGAAADNVGAAAKDAADKIAP